MNSNKEHYYNSIHITLLKALGIWHHDKSRLVLLQRVVITLVLVPHICMQVTAWFICITVETNLHFDESLIKVTALACPFSVMVMQYFVFVFKSDEILNIHNRIEGDWMLVRDTVEHDIIQKNAHSAHFYVTLTLYDNVLQHIPNSEKERAICKEIMYAVLAHRRALVFSKIIVSSFNALYCVKAIFRVLSLTINLYGIIEAVTISKIPHNTVLYCVSVVGHLMYMFVAMFVGQKITDCNDEVYNLTYDSLWYLMPVSSQKLVLFLLQKTGKEVCLTIGYLLVAKIETAT
ncbi:uncharacterized protein LOC109863361, partial [Pseudomyrmex gracilis]|uniref:uncharacterized protein LOC109863361 n=1 Tax=Pseudomyrmex gracilis TaxID=219809 RepID=UPI00099514AF